MPTRALAHRIPGMRVEKAIETGAGHLQIRTRAVKSGTGSPAAPRREGRQMRPGFAQVTDCWEVSQLAVCFSCASASI
jgi:hypothetical protein